MGDGETYSEPSQQVEETEVTGESFTHHDHRATVTVCTLCHDLAKGATFDPGP